MNYFPNVDAVTYFHKEIFPLIHGEIPSAKFVIAGMAPTPHVRALGDDSTLVTGFVPDIRPYLAKASVCVAPLRLAKGVQNKILEAMAMGVPVVATSAANRGIDAGDQQEIIIADDPKAFAAATVRLLRENNLRESIAANAKRFVAQKFCWEKNLRELDKVIDQVTNHAPQPGQGLLDDEEAKLQRRS
jgi:glycosyltransferase involved in cell wall biosynthesis